VSRNTYVFPDGRVAIVIRADGVVSPESKPSHKADPKQIKGLLKVGLSCNQISSHLRVPLRQVKSICQRWKQTELPNILKKRAVFLQNVSPED
jgi:hypothetical protein